MSRTLSLSLLCGLFIFPAGGCSWNIFSRSKTPEPEQTSPSAAQTAPTTAGLIALSKERQIDDLPVPEGFVRNKDLSYTYVTQSVRTAHLVYKGAYPMFDVVNFYEAHMPANGWAMGRIVQENETGKLRYVKNDDECLITILARAESTTLEIVLQPRR